MRVTNETSNTTISISELRDKLENGEGVLAHCSDGEISLIKTVSCDRCVYNRVWLSFDSELDYQINATNLDELMQMLSIYVSQGKQEIHWFESQQDFIEWIKSNF